jgi:hypothetical protein
LVLAWDFLLLVLVAVVLPPTAFTLGFVVVLTCFTVADYWAWRRAD